MTDNKWTVAGRAFRTRSDYEAALRDQKKIDAVRNKTKLTDLEAVTRLHEQIESGEYQFETAVGRDFDDEIYELKQALKKGNAAGTSSRSGSNKAKQSPKGKASRQITQTKKGTSRRNAANREEVDEAFRKEVLTQLKRQERRRKWSVAALLLVAAGSIGYFSLYSYDAQKAAKEAERLAGWKDAPAAADNNQQLIIYKTTETELEIPDVLEKYKSLYNKNKKLIGWIKIDDTLGKTFLNYPVMQTSDNEFYLSHNFEQENDRNGSIFMDKDCNVITESTNYIVYGHNMKSGKMFGGLSKYESEDFYKTHPVIQFDTIYREARYEVMYVFRDHTYSEADINFKYYQFIDAGSEEEFNSYMREMQEKSYYDTGVVAEYGDQLLTLSTCDYQQDNGRFVVIAKRIK